MSTKSGYKFCTTKNILKLYKYKDEDDYGLIENANQIINHLLKNGELNTNFILSLFPSLN